MAIRKLRLVQLEILSYVLMNGFICIFLCIVSVEFDYIGMLQSLDPGMGLF